MAAGGKSRREIEDLWRERLKRAQTDYERAIDTAMKALTEWRYIPSPDGFAAIRQTSAAERAARAEYMRVLHIFHDFMVQNKMPPED